MRATEIIRNLLDILDQVEDAETQPAVVVQVSAEEPANNEYANTPNEVISPLGAAYPAGDDMHQSKNPADIRTNAPSMYPNYQAR